MVWKLEEGSGGLEGIRGEMEKQDGLEVKVSK